MSNQPLIEFKPKLPKLSKNEKVVLKLLVDAGKLIAPLYLEQEKQAEHGVSREEMEKASKQDPAILSPYTVVEKKNGKITTMPYHIKYAKFLQPIAKKLIEAGDLSENKQFGDFLKLQANALLEGKYEEAIIAGLRLSPYILDASIVPIEHLDDNLFYGKASYSAWVGVLEKEGTDRFNNYKSIILSARRKALIPGERIENNDNVKGKVIDVVLLSGLMARTKFVGVSLPMNLNMVEKYGSEITIFNQSNDLRMKERIIPIFDKIFPKAFREEYSSEDLRRGYLRTIAMHELAHGFLRYKNSESNLQEFFLIIDELAATVLGLRMAGSLFLKDRITGKQLESMIVTFLCRGFYTFENKEDNKSPFSYTVGNSIFINYLFKSGALKKSGNTIILNFMKVFLSLHDLSEILERLLASGSHQDAKSFIKKYI